MKSIIEFLETYVNGKTLYTKELVYELENGSLQGVYSDQISFSNLKYSQTGFQFDMFIVSNEKIYAPGKNKAHEELRKDFSSVSLFRFELAKRKSTQAITGFFRFISASMKDVPAEAVISAIYDVTLENGLLRFQEDQALYRDHPAKDGSHRPVSFLAEHRLFMENEKLRYEYNGKCFDVDAVTLRRKESGDHYPPFISVEK